MQYSFDKLFYGGRWHDPSSPEGRIDVVSPDTEEVIGSAPRPVAADVDAAVAAGRAAFDDPNGWANWSVEMRADAMEHLAAVAEARGEDFARVVSSENGMPIKLSRVVEAHTGPALLRYYAGLIRQRGAESTRTGPTGRTVTVRTDPVGLVASIVAWNYPISLSFVKLAPLLAAGCTTVLKPAQETVLNSYLLAEVIAESRLPAGVVNIIAGGREVGAQLVEHSGVDKVSFTGSTDAGRSVARRCGELLRPVTLELGGKSAAVVLDDVDMSAVAKEFIHATTVNSGQTCWLSTRILVPRIRYAELTDAITDLVRTQSVGPALDEATDVGPMASSAHRDRVEGFIRAGIASGSRVTTGGGRPEQFDRGWFVEPTVFADVDNRSVVARSEIFGPVLCIIPYDGVDEAVSLANDSEFGLGGTVWTADEERGAGVARRIRAGAVGINGYRGELCAPTGGVKSSGIGREMGPEGLAGYQSLKSIFPSPAR